MKTLKATNKRLLSFVLAFCMVLGLVCTVAEQPAEAYNMDNAPAATLAQLEETQLKYAYSDHGTGFRIIDGELWVWGQNVLYELGFTELNGEAVTSATVIASPIKHPYNSTFTGKLVQVTSSYGAVAVRTDEDRVYSWGGDIYFRDETSETHHVEYVPFECDTTAIRADGGIASMQGSSVGLVALSKNGNYFMCADLDYTRYPTGTDGSCSAIFRPLLSTYIDKLQPAYDGTKTDAENTTALTTAKQNVGGANRWYITNIVFSGQAYTTFYVMQQKNTNGTFKAEKKVWVTTSDWGYNSFMQGLRNNKAIPVELTNTDCYSRTCYSWVTTARRDNDITANTAMIAAEPQWETLATSRYTTAVIDKDGSVWAAGCNGYGIPYTAGMVYDRRVTQVKAVKVVTSGSSIIVIGEDNSIWAYGLNANQYIDATQAATAYITTATCVFQAQSLAQTITGVFITNKGVMVITKSGDQYYAGDNTGGAAGNGTQSNEGFGSGQVGEATSSTIPPVEPMTANKIYFEIESKDGTYAKQDDGSILFTYVDADNKTKTKTVSDPITLKAGSKCTLHVFFEDVARMNGFVMPVRFDPKYIRIVNGEGRQYPENEISSPGAIGASVGIQRQFTAREWSGGYLLGEGETAGEYPKICNTGGWFSVMGHSTDTKAKIEGKVEMFSVDFIVIETASVATTFLIANDKNQNVFVTNTVSVAKYDETGLENQNRGGGFIVSNTTPGGRDGEFLFKEVSGGSFPGINALVVLADEISLTVTKADGSIPQKESTPLPVVPDGGNADEHKYTGWVLPSANTAETYVVKSIPDPTDASFPAVDWSVELITVDGPQINDEGNAYVLSDFIGMTDPQDTTLRFKLSDSINKDKTAVIKVSAITKQNGTSNEKKQAETTIIIKSMEAPGQIRIKEKADKPDGTFIYTATDATYLNSVTTKFTVEFPLDENNENFSNTAVVWRLLDDTGTEITSSTAKAPAYITSVSGAVGRPSLAESGNWTPPSAKIAPAHSTTGDSYLTLRVESAYDSSISDSIKIKVHLKATSMTFKRDLLRLPTQTSKALNELLEIGPENDYYKVELYWSYEGLYQGIPTNMYSGAKITENATNVVRLASSGIVSADSVPTDDGFYEMIKVTDQISGLSASIAVVVLSLESPIKPSQIQVYNVVGSKGDYATVSGVLAGDIITFYQTYNPDLKYDPTKSASEQTNAFKQAVKSGAIQQYGPLTADQVKKGSYDFSLQDFLDSSGGELGFSVSRVQGDGDTNTMKEFDQLPVSYDCEPSKVYGYISLAGKTSTTDRRAGIAVQLSGPSNPDIVYTDANGYFEFKTYIRPGTYSMSIYLDNYMKRVIQPDAAKGYAGIVISAAEEFAISTDKNPIELYPGDLNDDGAINATDINQYIRSWVGKTIKTEDPTTFAHYDFYDGAYEVIDLSDLDIIARHNGWTRENYPLWNVPTVK